MSCEVTQSVSRTRRRTQEQQYVLSALGSRRRNEMNSSRQTTEIVRTSWMKDIVSLKSIEAFLRQYLTKKEE